MLGRELLRAAIAGLIIFAASCATDHDHISARDDNASFARMNQTGTLRAGYIPVPPKLIVDPNTGKVSGIMHDALMQAAANLGITIDYLEEVTWATMVEAVESQRIDVVVAGIWPSAARARRADFSSPIFFSSVNAYVRDGDDRFDGALSRLDNEEFSIATIDGEMSAVVAAADFPRARVVTLPNISDAAQVLLQVAAGKADATFMEPAIALAYLAKNPGSIRQVADTPPVRVFGNTYLVSKSEWKLRRTLDTALDELRNSGSIGKILRRYETFPGSFLPVAPPYATN